MKLRILEDNDAELMFHTKHIRPKQQFEINKGKSKVETAGYIPAKMQIENMILAGQRLAEYRQGLYDFGPNDPDDDSFYDPTRRPNYDMAEAAQDALSVSRRLSEQAERAKEQENAKKTSSSGFKAGSKQDDGSEEVRRVDSVDNQEEKNTGRKAED